MCWPFKHQWEVKERHPVDITSDGEVVGAFVVFILKCTKCGWLSRKKFRT